MSPPIAMDPALGIALRLGLALVLLGSSRHKLRDFAAFRSAVSNYRIVPERWGIAAAALLLAIELAVGLWLAFPGAGAAPALAAAALLTIYSAAIAVNLLRGRREIDCGCAGRGTRRPLSEGLLLRNAALIGLAALCAVPMAGRALVWIDAVTAVAGVVVWLLLYAAIDASLAIAPRLRELRGRS